MAFPPTYQILRNQSNCKRVEEFRDQFKGYTVLQNRKHTCVRMYENFKIIFLLGYRIIL